MCPPLLADVARKSVRGAVRPRLDSFVSEPPVWAQRDVVAARHEPRVVLQRSRPEQSAIAERRPRIELGVGAEWTSATIGDNENLRVVPMGVFGAGGEIAIRRVV
jgi:hypothetical protein